MKLKLILLTIIFSATTLGYAADSSCDGLYSGKTIKLRNTGLLGGTIEAIVLGVDKDSGLVSIKLTDSGRTREGSCSFLKQEMR